MALAFRMKDLRNQQAFWHLKRYIADVIAADCPEGFRAEIEQDFATQDVWIRMTSDGIKGSARNWLPRAVIEDLLLGLFPLGVRHRIIGLRDTMMEATCQWS